MFIAFAAALFGMHCVGLCSFSVIIHNVQGCVAQTTQAQKSKV